MLFLWVAFFQEKFLTMGSIFQKKSLDMGQKFQKLRRKKNENHLGMGQNL